MKTSPTARFAARARFSALVLLLLALLLLVSGTSAMHTPRRATALGSRFEDGINARRFNAPSPHGCEAHATQGACHTPCVWCTSAAVPSACYNAKEAAKLPPAVFVCDTSGR